MDLHIISWNVNGMHFTNASGPRKLRLRREITTHVSRPVDILLVQEHKLSYAHTQRCGKLLPGVSHSFWEPAVGDHLSSGGVCISVGSRWLPRVIDHGTLVAGRAMWVSLQCDAYVVGILCIYAPTTAAERSWFWDQIVHVLPPVNSWIVGGDFNNELLLRNTTTNPQLISELRQKNCWKLWKHRSLSVEQISFVLRIRQNTVHGNILNYERTVDHVDWIRLSKLVGLTTSTAEAILMETVTPLHINLVHAMLERGLKASEISHVASSAIEEGNHVEEKIQGQNTVFTSPPDRGQGSNAAFSECFREEERVGIRNPALLFWPNQVDLFSGKSEQVKEDAEFRNSRYADEGVDGQKTEALADYFHQNTTIARPKYSVMLDLVQWFRKNQMVEYSKTFGVALFNLEVKSSSPH
ncbi:hypothetical protein L7F22_034943 [Adiantum nelumboides]|nr:hypothetical protein [Adiantum nelumboides]